MTITFNTMTTSIHIRSSAQLTFEMMMLSSGPTGIQRVIMQTHLFIAPLTTLGPGHLNFHAVLLRPLYCLAKVVSVQDIAIENEFAIGNDFIQIIETTPETGAAATATVSGLCPVPVNMHAHPGMQDADSGMHAGFENAEAVSAGAEAYRKANALVLAYSEVSSDAAVPRAAAAHENPLFHAIENVSFIKRVRRTVQMRMKNRFY